MSPQAESALREAFRRLPADMADVVQRVRIDRQGVRVYAGRRVIRMRPEPWHGRRAAVAAEQMWEIIRADDRRRLIDEARD